jgi:hypothetical protein
VLLPRFIFRVTAGPLAIPVGRAYTVAINLISWRDRDPGAEVLLDLDGQVFVVDPKGGYWVRFSVNRIASTPERPHGLKYNRAHCGGMSGH